MAERERLARQFERKRPRLHAVAHRILGSAGEAEDAVQEAWIRLHRSDPEAVENLDGWLTTVVGRVCLDMLRARARREEMLEEQFRAPAAAADTEAADPEQAAVVADSVGLALLVVLDTLDPVERLVFVLHDMFAVPFAGIAPIVDRSPAAARQLASRARRRVRGAVPLPDLRRQREIVDAFLAASRDGEFDRLLQLLAPGVVMNADRTSVDIGATAVVRGAHDVAKSFSGRALLARPALVDGMAGAVWETGGRPAVVFRFTVEDDVITAIDLVAERERLDGPDLVVLAG
ncbi:sigma-70 family RNA polymerase sigma factor [Streptomyces sp. CMB-StM0423]|uniref:sigma-70 family RNA polymerase sigma factor n=1 Tax=Streptomyces sp. CMB-StM0423 TaxID=2059884 RepID=UPI000C705885|nr:sigma-70 family RNA polymerase sigma factor [Streptomyces sp. CMB-StM0423]AUH39563.1 RNA polymerase subunit sigma-70 [Streptomyces sp. CMB-StM0423]